MQIQTSYANTDLLVDIMYTYIRLGGGPCPSLLVDLRGGVSLGILRLPAPKIFAHFIESQFRFPAQFVLGQLSIGVVNGNISRSSIANDILDFVSTRLAHGMDHVEDAASVSGPQVEGIETR
jgi:hypothetical protein